MANIAYSSTPGKQISTASVITWRIVQWVVWLVGFSIFLSLIFFPRTGLLLFWNILIPVAPALLVVATGVWRNICPLASTVMLPRHLGFSAKRKMSVKTQAKLQLLAVVALYAIVPLRHTWFNTNGIATAALLSGAALTGTVMGFFYDWKSSWCSSLCPVHPVEKLYGSRPVKTVANMHCTQCVNCSIPCPDSTPNFSPAIPRKTIYHTISGLLIIGGLPGFIWGWFHVPDSIGPAGITGFLNTYKMPLIGFTVTLALYQVLNDTLPRKYQPALVSLFAAAGVSCYYWYRIPALLGFGPFGNDGLLIRMTDIIPSWVVTLFVVATTVFFFAWMLIPAKNSHSWSLRPEFAVKAEREKERLG